MNDLSTAPRKTPRLDGHAAVVVFPAEARRRRLRTLREAELDLSALRDDLERENAELFRLYRETCTRLAEVVAELDQLRGRAS